MPPLEWDLSRTVLERPRPPGEKQRLMTRFDVPANEGKDWRNLEPLYKINLATRTLISNALQVEFQNSVQFCDRLRQLARPVRARNDALRFRAGQVRTPVRHYTVAAVGRISLAAVTDD